MTASGTARRGTWLLAAGALVGAVLAATGLIDKPFDTTSITSGGLPESAIARIDNAFIPRARYLQLLHDLQSDRKGPLDQRDRQFVLNRLIDEELLVLQGQRLGLQSTSPEVRKALAAAVMAQVAAEAEAVAPTEQDLRSLYASDAAFFATTPRYRVRVWQKRLSGDNPPLPGTIRDEIRQRLERKTARVESIESTLAEMGFERLERLPDTALPAAKLADYLGPDLTRLAIELGVGEITPARLQDDRLVVLQLLSHETGETAPYEQLRPQLEAEWFRRQSGSALEAYLAELRNQADIQVAGDISPTVELTDQ